MSLRRTLIAASLALNLVLIGVSATLSVPHLFPPPPPPSKAEKTLRTLLPERRKLIETRIRDMRGRVRGDQDRSEELRLAVTYRLRDPNFDRQAWEKALHDWFEERDRQRDQMVNEIGNLAETLNQPERVALSRMLDENRPRPPRH